MDFIIFSILLLLIIFAVIIAINYAIANKMRDIAFSKGYNDNFSFHLCFWLGYIGYLYVIALPNRIQMENQKKIISLLSGNCELEKSTQRNTNTERNNKKQVLDDITKYRCEEISVSELEFEGTCTMCRTGDRTLKYCKIKKDIGTPICEECIKRFQENCSTKS